MKPIKVNEAQNTAVPRTETKPTPKLKATRCAGADCGKELGVNFIQIGRKRYCFQCAEKHSSEW